MCTFNAKVLTCFNKLPALSLKPTYITELKVLSLGNFCVRYYFTIPVTSMESKYLYNEKICAKKHIRCAQSKSDLAQRDRGWGVWSTHKNTHQMCTYH